MALIERHFFWKMGPAQLHQISLSPVTHIHTQDDYSKYLAQASNLAHGLCSLALLLPPYRFLLEMQGIDHTCITALSR